MDAERKLREAADICYEFRYAINALNAIHAAIEFGPYGADSFADALFFVYVGLDNKREELQNLLEKE